MKHNAKKEGICIWDGYDQARKDGMQRLNGWNIKQGRIRYARKICNEKGSKVEYLMPCVYPTILFSKTVCNIENYE